MIRKTNRRKFIGSLLGVATAAALPAEVKSEVKLPCGLRELPVGWIFEYGLRRWNGDTHKEFVRERARSYKYGGKQFSAEEYAQRMIEELIKQKHGITVLRYYPVYAGKICDCLHLISQRKCNDPKH